MQSFFNYLPGQPVGYTYNAGVHCVSCAEADGMTGENPAPLDREGNPAGAVFSDSESQYPQSCEQCGAEIPATWIEGCDECDKYERHRAPQECQPPPPAA